MNKFMSRPCIRRRVVSVCLLVLTTWLLPSKMEATNFISDVKVSIQGNETDAINGISGYTTAISYKSGGNYVYIGIKTTTDPTKGVTGLMIVDNQGIKEDDRYLEGGDRWIVQDNKKYYKVPMWVPVT